METLKTIGFILWCVSPVIFIIAFDVDTDAGLAVVIVTWIISATYVIGNDSYEL